MVQQKTIYLPNYRRGFHLITPVIERELGEIPATGILNLFIQHTSAALSLNENADPDVRHDMESAGGYPGPGRGRCVCGIGEGDPGEPAGPGI